MSSAILPGCPGADRVQDKVGCYGMADVLEQVPVVRRFDVLRAVCFAEKADAVWRTRDVGNPAVFSDWLVLWDGQIL